jgi:hypothetical protein
MRIMFAMLMSTFLGVQADSAPSDDDLRAADLAIVAMRAGFDERNPTAQYSFGELPFSDPVPLASARVALARLPKPILCVFSRTQGIDYVRCRPLTTTEAQEHQITAARAEGSIISAVTRFCKGADDPTVELRSVLSSNVTTGPRLFRLSTVSNWLKSYRLVFASRLDEADQRARGLGACAVLLIGPPFTGTIHPHSLLRPRING